MCKVKLYRNRQNWNKLSTIHSVYSLFFYSMSLLSHLSTSSNLHIVYLCPWITMFTLHHLLHLFRVSRSVLSHYLNVISCSNRYETYTGLYTVLMWSHMVMDVRLTRCWDSMVTVINSQASFYIRRYHRLRQLYHSLESFHGLQNKVVTIFYNQIIASLLHLAFGYNKLKYLATFTIMNRMKY